MTTPRAPFSPLSTLVLAAACVACTAKSTGQGTTGSSGGAGTASGSAGETDGSAECMTRFDAESCAELGDACEFTLLENLHYQWDGGPTCTQLQTPGYGWCFPRVNGGSDAPQAFWNPMSGEMVWLAFGSLSLPMGWERCGGDPGNPPCCCSGGLSVELPYCGAGASTGGTGGSTSTGTGG